MFGYLLETTGLWSSCWIVLTVISLICLISMHRVARRIMTEEAPELVQLIENRPATALAEPVTTSDAGAVSTVEDLLKAIPFFSNLSPEKLRDLARIGVREHAAAETVLFAEGDPGETLYVILKGAVRVTAGSGVELTRFKAGDYFGELALLDGRPRSASVETTEDSELLIVSRRDFLTLLSDSPRTLGDLLVNLSGKIRRHVAYRSALEVRP